MKEQKFWDIINLGYVDAAKSKGTLRKGQAVWNTFVDFINEEYPDKIQELRDLLGTENDPFYLDSNLPNFIEAAKRILSVEAD